MVKVLDWIRKLLNVNQDISLLQSDKGKVIFLMYERGYEENLCKLIKKGIEKGVFVGECDYGSTNHKTEDWSGKN